jgi:hypothetical protein
MGFEPPTTMGIKRTTLQKCLQTIFAKIGFCIKNTIFSKSNRIYSKFPDTRIIFLQKNRVAEKSQKS